MLNSMTAFASCAGASDAFSWVIELRGVNAKGLDIRLRLPDALAGFEAKMRAQLQSRFGRGSISFSLKIDQSAGAAQITLDEQTAEAYLAAAIRIRTIAKNKGLKLPPSTATDFLALRGVVSAVEASNSDYPVDAIMDDFTACIEEFAAMRASEGAALTMVLTGQIDQIETLTSEAAGTIEARRDAQAETLKANLAKLTVDVDPDRIAQELALMIVKSDVTEELDRLRAHIDAARELLVSDGPVGRRLDFLMQEFNREANTLCSKSNHAELTRIGLDLKTVIDQMREQIQNVE